MVGHAADSRLPLADNLGLQQDPEPVTPDQVITARYLLRWSRVRLASRSDVPVSMLTAFEQKKRPMPADMLDAVRTTLEAAGIEFTEDLQPEMRPQISTTANAIELDRLSAKVAAQHVEVVRLTEENLFNALLEAQDNLSDLKLELRATTMRNAYRMKKS